VLDFRVVPNWMQIPNIMHDCTNPLKNFDLCKTHFSIIPTISPIQQSPNPPYSATVTQSQKSLVHDPLSPNSTNTHPAAQTSIATVYVQQSSSSSGARELLVATGRYGSTTPPGVSIAFRIRNCTIEGTWTSDRPARALTDQKRLSLKTSKSSANLSDQTVFRLRQSNLLLTSHSSNGRFPSIAIH
jgi:hypothetical protein